MNETVSERIFSYLEHPTSDSSFQESKICIFGKKIIYILLIYLLIRTCLPTNLLKKFNPYVLLITFILSFSNFNTLFYNRNIFTIIENIIIKKAVKIAKKVFVDLSLLIKRLLSSGL